MKAPPTPTRGTQLLPQIEQVAGERQGKLATLLQRDPAAALAGAAQKNRVALPAALQKLVEQDVEVEGALECSTKTAPAAACCALREDGHRRAPRAAFRPDVGEAPPDHASASKA